MTEEAPPCFAEAWRIVWQHRDACGGSGGRCPFLAASLIGFASLASLFYEEVFDLDERARGFVGRRRRAVPSSSA